MGDYLQNILDMQSQMIISKKSKESADNEHDAQQNKLDAMPYALIGKCASYLKQKDYMNLSIANRTVYCATNSPNTLRKLELFFHMEKKNMNLGRFKLLQSLRIHTHPSDNFLLGGNTCTHLTKLQIMCGFSSDQFDVKALGIPLGKITSLSLKWCGRPGDLFDFNAFCKVLSHFPNILTLELKSIRLSDFNSDCKLPHMPMLNELNIDDGNNSLNLLRNKLLKVHSKQLISIEFREKRIAVDVHSFPKLKALKIFDPKQESLQAIIDSSPNIESMVIPIPDVQNMKETIISSFVKLDKLKSMTLYFV